MTWHSLATAVAVSASLIAALAPSAGAQTPPPTPDATRISGPVVHGNLAVYILHGPSASGPVPLTLAEAMTAGKVTVHETGRVSELAIENAGDEAVFVQAGDIVKGGRQDRVLTVSFLVPPGSGRVPIGAYCVERGRWTARGKEDSKRFASAGKAVPSRAAKLAMLAPAKPDAGARATSALDSPARSERIGRPIMQGVTRNFEDTRQPADPDQEAARNRIRQALQSRTSEGSRQSEIWALVDSTQRKLSANVGTSVAAATSATSLQLALENERLDALRKPYLDHLRTAGEAPADAVGYVLAVNGRIASGDLYASNGLFRKMWLKQLEAAATEAIAEKPADQTSAGQPPAIGDVRAFIERAQSADITASNADGANLVRETRDTDAALFMETRHASGGILHRSFLARR